MRLKIRRSEVIEHALRRDRVLVAIDGSLERSNTRGRLPHLYIISLVMCTRDDVISIVSNTVSQPSL